MVLIEWSPKLSVDIKIIDEQHKKLVGYLNNLYDAINNKKEKAILSQLFKDLDDYTKTHFLVEEKYFEKFNYPDKESHIMQHKEFIRKLNDFKKLIGKESMDSDDLLTFLVDWLMNHIKVIDHQYTECFHANGLK